MSSGPIVGLLDTLTFPELMTFLVIALIVLGPDKLPGIARSAGRWVQKLRSMADSLQDEVKGALDESEMQQLKELGEFAVRPRAKLAEYARKAATDSGDDDAIDAAADDHTDGDAPAASAPTLPPLGVGADNPMVTNAPSTPAPAPTAPAPTSDVVTRVEASSAGPSPSPRSPTRSSVPPHLAGTYLATAAGAGDPFAAPATDAEGMSDPSTEATTETT